MLFPNFAPADMKGTTSITASYDDHHKALLLPNFQQHYFHRPKSGHHHQPASSNATEVESRTADPAGNHHKREAGDGSSVEVVRRPRGRPPGSKNKPKQQPVLVARDAPDRPEVLRPHVLEIPGGRDVAAALTAFCRRRDLGLSVLSATGSLSDLTLRQPDSAHSPAATFRGRFEILSVSATIFPPSSAAAATAGGGGFSVTVAGPHGRVLGGAVAGPMVAAGTVTVVAAAFSSSSFSRMPADDEKTPAEDHGSSGGSIMVAAETSGMPVSSGHLLSDVIWAPTARQPPPPY